MVAARTHSRVAVEVVCAVDDARSGKVSAKTKTPDHKIAAAPPKFQCGYDTMYTGEALINLPPEQALKLKNSGVKPVSRHTVVRDAFDRENVVLGRFRAKLVLRGSQQGEESSKVLEVVATVARAPVARVLLGQKFIDKHEVVMVSAQAHWPDGFTNSREGIDIVRGLQFLDAGSEVAASAQDEEFPFDLSNIPRQELRERLKALLLEKHIENVWKRKVGCVRGVKMDIKLKPGAEPVKSRSYPQNPHRMQAVKAELDKLVKLGIIRRSRSPWRSPLVIAAKPDGGLRICVDYRKVNNLTVDDSYPPPRTDVLLDAVCHAKFFSKLDMEQGFHQVEMEDKSIEVTAFDGGDSMGCWEFTRMPFGLKGGPAAFQRAVDQCLNDLIGRGVVIYIDDVLVYSSDLESHFEILRATLERLASAGFKLKAKKCKFLAEKAEYLGHEITEEGLRPLQRNIAKILEMHKARTPKQLERFVSACGYYRKFIPKFSELVRPLKVAVQRDGEYKLPSTLTWTSEMNEAHDKLVRAMSDTPVLVQPNWDLPFEVHADASLFAVSGVLMQGGRIVRFFSKTLNASQKKYGSTQREILALLLAIEHFAYYLRGRSFTMYTDHQPIVWLQDNEAQDSMFARWLERFQRFSFVAKYVEGKKNVVPDFGSRLPRDEEQAARDKDEQLEATRHPGLGQLCVKRDASAFCEFCKHRCSVLEYRVSDQLMNTLPPSSPIKKTGEHAAPGEELPDVDLEEMPPPIDGDAEDMRRELFGEDEEEESEERALGTEPSGEPRERYTAALWRKRQRRSTDLGPHMRKGRDLPETWQAVRQSLHRDPDDGVLRHGARVCVPGAYQNAVMHGWHSVRGIGHMSARVTLGEIRRHFFWPAMAKDVTDFVASCEVCQRFHKDTARKPPLASVDGGPHIFSRLQIDLIDFHMNASSEGHKYVLHAVCLRTMTPFLVALKDKKAITVAKALLHHVIRETGVPDVVQSDRGREFTAEIMEALAKLLGFKRVFGAPAAPQTQGAVERGNAEVKKHLRALVFGRNRRDWHEHLWQVELTLRNHVNSVTGVSPNELIMGHRTRLPIEHEIGLPIAFEREVRDSDSREYVERLEKFLEWRRAVARQNQIDFRCSESLRKSGGREDERRPDGSWILRRLQPQERKGSLAPRWSLPMLVVSMNRGAKSYVVRSLKGGIEHVHHRDTRAYKFPGQQQPSSIAEAKEQQYPRMP